MLIHTLNSIYVTNTTACNLHVVGHFDSSALNRGSLCEGTESGLGQSLHQSSLVWCSAKHLRQSEHFIINIIIIEKR